MDGLVFFIFIVLSLLMLLRVVVIRGSSER